MSKDINIHLKTTGAEQTKQQLEQTGQAAKDVGQKTSEGQKQAGVVIDDTTKKLGVMGRVLNTLKSQAISLITGMLGLHAVVKLVTFLIEKLERIAELQKQIYEKSLQFAEIGQALEFQTGTIGQQQFWTQEALDLQKAGALRGPEVAQQMLVSMDIAFKESHGGILNAQVRDIGKQLAPFIGAAGARGLGPEEVSKVFEFAGTAGIEPTTKAYKDYFTKLWAGYTASNAVDFGQFMMGLQKGGTGYMAMGGTLEDAISTFSAARTVTPNESLAANLVEQIARLSGGGYEKPRAAIEKALGVKWPDLSMNKRTATLLQYVGRIPEAERAQTLAEQSFPVELTTQIGKMVSPQAMRTLDLTRRKVEEATVGMIDQLSQAYIESPLGQARELEGKKAGKIAARGPDFAGWQRRLDDAKTDFQDILSRRMDTSMLDSLEPYLNAFRNMQDELLTPQGKIPESGPSRRLWFNIQREINFMHEWTWTYYLLRRGPKQGLEFSRRLDAQLNLRRRAPSFESPAESPTPIPPPPAFEAPPTDSGKGPVSYNYDHRVNHITIFNPVVGMNKQDLRIEPPYLG